jgi:hypothetical protein
MTYIRKNKEYRYQKTELLCLDCNEVLPIGKFKIHRKTSKGNPKYSNRCKVCCGKRDKPKDYDILKLFVGTLKQECVACGYRKSKKALHMHHLDPLKKSAAIGDMLIVKDMTFDAIKKEVEKCIVLCSNCHIEHHEGLLEIEVIVL